MTDDTTTDLAGLHTALAASDSPHPAGPVAACRAYAWRGLLKIKHMPEQLVDVTIGPILLLVTFTYLFGGAIEGSTRDYLQFVLPGILAMAVLFTAVYSGTTLHADVHSGVTDRFRSLPVWRAAPLVGTVLADTVRYATAATVVIAAGLLLGFRAAGGIAGLALGAAVVIIFAFALSWLFTTLGLLVRSASAVQGIGMLGIFLLVFFSNVFVDPDTLPRALEVVVRLNPISHLVTATRALIAGDADPGQVGLVLAEAATLTAVFATLTSRLYGRT